MASKRRSALGRGLDSLMAGSGPSPVPVREAKEAQASQDVSDQGVILRLSADAIQPNRLQPRQDFDQEALQELAESIRQSGMIQPLIVRQADGAYELVAGERRLRAAKIAGLAEVPCLLAEVDADHSLLMALIENIQREDLNPVEEAEAYARLRDDLGLSQEQLATQVGKSRVAVANSLRLLNLPREIQEDVRDGTITAGHARALLGVPDRSRLKSLWLEIKRRQLSVREAEERCRALGGGRPRQTSAFTGRPRGRRDPELASLEDQLMGRLGCRISIQRRGKSRGRVVLHFATGEEFERILEILGLPAGNRL